MSGAWCDVKCFGVNAWTEVPQGVAFSAVSKHKPRLYGPSERSDRARRFTERASPWERERTQRVRRVRPRRVERGVVRFGSGESKGSPFLGISLEPESRAELRLWMYIQGWIFDIFGPC